MSNPRLAAPGARERGDHAAGAVELVVDRSRENRGAGDDRNGDQNQEHHILRRHSPILVLHPGPDTGQRRLHLHEQTEKHLSPPFALYHSGTPSGALPTRARLTAREQGGRAHRTIPTSPDEPYVVLRTVGSPASCR